MRQEIYLTQDEIDEIVQKEGAYRLIDYNNFRALQDGLINEVKTAFAIYRRKT